MLPIGPHRGLAWHEDGGTVFRLLWIKCLALALVWWALHILFDRLMINCSPHAHGLIGWHVFHFVEVESLVLIWTDRLILIFTARFMFLRFIIPRLWWTARILLLHIFKWLLQRISVLSIVLILQYRVILLILILKWSSQRVLFTRILFVLQIKLWFLLNEFVGGLLRIGWTQRVLLVIWIIVFTSGLERWSHGLDCFETFWVQVGEHPGPQLKEHSEGPDPHQLLDFCMRL